MECLLMTSVQRTAILASKMRSCDMCRRSMAKVPVHERGPSDNKTPGGYDSDRGALTLSSSARLCEEHQLLNHQGVQNPIKLLKQIDSENRSAVCRWQEWVVYV